MDGRPNPTRPYWLYWKLALYRGAQMRSNSSKSGLRRDLTSHGIPEYGISFALTYTYTVKHNSQIHWQTPTHTAWPPLYNLYVLERNLSTNMILFQSRELNQLFPYMKTERSLWLWPSWRFNTHTHKKNTQQSQTRNLVAYLPSHWHCLVILERHTASPWQRQRESERDKLLTRSQTCFMSPGSKPFPDRKKSHNSSDKTSQYYLQHPTGFPTHAPSEQMNNW